jgi:hypothetical protein
MKKKNYKMETEKPRGTKNYIRRMYEQFEAEDEIREYTPVEEEEREDDKPDDIQNTIRS